MGITSSFIRHTPPLRAVSFTFNEQVNLFIGPNASGKSTVLRAIHDSLFVTPEFYDYADGHHFFMFGSWDGDLPDEDSWFNAEVDIQLPGSHDSHDSVSELIPVLYVPATRLSLMITDDMDSAVDDLASEEDEDGLLEELEWELKELFEPKSAVFNGQSVQEAIHRLSTVSSRFSVLRFEFRNALQEGHACARQICSDIIFDTIPHSHVESIRESGASDPTMVAHYGMGIGTIDDPLGIPLYAGALSSGTQGTLLWIYALSLKIASHYRWTTGWQQKPAILLIDEIENHLHPTWQRRVIPALLEHFPGLQIFATTHSPFVVAGLKAGQVHLLQRDEEGHVTATTNPEDVIGWTADEILRNMMGVDDPTDKVTAEAAQELRKLRNQGPENVEVAEAERQQRMHELRQLVNRELLAGGPMAAQRELFEQHLTEILEEHRRSENLNQDGG